MGRAANARAEEGTWIRINWRRKAPQIETSGASGQEMETYSYVDIFATKGLEYVLLGCFLVMFILFVKYLAPPGSK